MSDKKISELTATATLAESDVFPVVNSSTTKKITLANLRSQVSSTWLTDLLPATDDTYDIGSALKRWQDLFLSGAATVTGAVVSKTDTLVKPFIVVGTSGAVDYVCDGTADDAQIQAALDAVTAAGGGTIFIKKGTYNIATMLSFNCSNVAIIGEGYETILKAGTGVVTVLQTGFVPYSNHDNIVIKDICFDGNNQSLAQTVVHFVWASYSLVDNCIFKNAAAHPLDTWNGVGLGTNTLTKSLIRGCTFLNNAHYGLTLYLSSYVRVEGCLSEGNLHHGIGYTNATYCSIVGNIIIGDSVNTTDLGIDGTAGSDHILIADNIIYGSFTTMGIVVGSSNTVVDGNIINDTSATATLILVTTGLTDIIVSNNKLEGGANIGIQARASYSSIIGNQISNVATGADGAGIILDAPYQSCISNVVMGCAKCGIYAAADHCTVNDNVIINNGTVGILFFNTDKNSISNNVVRTHGNAVKMYTATYNIFSGNEFLDSTGYAVNNADANCDYNTFLGNTFSGNVSGTMTGTVGANSEIGHNIGY